MPKKIELDAIIKGNPQVDLEKLREGIELSKELQNRGVTARGYELPPPYARKRAEVVDNAFDDPRLFRLRRTA